jgi:mono/diheme cytochrome c family protein
MRVHAKSLIMPTLAGVVVAICALAYASTAAVTAAPGKAGAHAQKLTRSEKLKQAMKACKKDKSKSKRKSCEKAAQKKYGASHHKTAAKETGTSTPATTGAATTGTGMVGGTVTTGAGATGTGTTGAGTTGAGTTGAGTTGAGTTGAGTTGAGTTATGTTATGTTGTGATGGTTTGGAEAAKKAAELERAQKAPTMPSAALVMKGQAVFATNCASCHGPGGHGENTANPEETNLAQTCGCGNPIYPRALSVRGVMEELIEPPEEPHQKQNFDQKLTIEEKEVVGAWVCVEVTQKFSNCG